MNEVIEQLHARKSVRVFTDEPVTSEEEREILEAACQAPTAGNQQLYSIIVVRDGRKKAALAESCDHQPFIAKAPLVLAFCADVRRWYRGFTAAGTDPREPGVGDFLLAMEDTMIAAQNAVVAAESLGIGSCYMATSSRTARSRRASSAARAGSCRSRSWSSVVRPRGRSAGRSPCDGRSSKWSSKTRMWTPATMCWWCSSHRNRPMSAPSASANGTRASRAR